MVGLSAILTLPPPPSDGDLGPLPAAQVEEDLLNMKQASQEQNTGAPATVATHTRTIGIIHPPPDIRNIVDKTAQFVAKNGPEFEKRILANNAGNVKFNFLIGSDPYHAYYEHRIAEFRVQLQSSAQSPEASESASEAGAAALASDSNEVARFDAQAQFKPVQKVLEPPEAQQYTVQLPDGITGEDVDIIKLTAQFVARNGRSFLTELTGREINNPQFHFLKPTHSMFIFFTALADVYSKVLMPTTGLEDKLKKGAADMTTVLERCLHRLEWDKSQEQARQKADDEVEQERIQMAMIDWHDFVVVETIEFADDEDEVLPNPMTLDEVIRKISNVEEDEVLESGKEVAMDMDEEEVQLVEEAMKVTSLEENHEEKSTNEMKAPDEPEQPMKIVKNWKRPEERNLHIKDPTMFGISPITGELIPVKESAEHMRISLIDPKFKEQKERASAKHRENTLASDDEISKNIDRLSRTRPDIFGTTEEEVSNAVKPEIATKLEEQVIWDGHSGSIGRTANQALSQTIFVEEHAVANSEARNLAGPAALPPRPAALPLRPLPPPPGLTLNVPRPTSAVPFPVAGGGLVIPPPPPQRPQMMLMFPGAQPPQPMPMASGQQTQHPHMVRPPPPPGSTTVGINPPSPSGSQFTPMGVSRPFMPMQMPPHSMSMVPPPHSMSMIHPPPMPHGMPPPLPEEAPPPLPDEPEPKRQRVDGSHLKPEDQFLALHPGSVRILIAVPNTDEGNLKGQLLEITIQSLSENVGSLKEKIAGEVQLPANKQKLSGRAGFLKDNLSLAYYNIGPGEMLTLALRERGGRKR